MSERLISPNKLIAIASAAIFIGGISVAESNMPEERANHCDVALDSPLSWAICPVVDAGDIATYGLEKITSAGMNGDNQ